jgi:isoaspartyl peptidase/L-asparaginase-like protein (Ntn-hydrolase superfamily)
LTLDGTVECDAAIMDGQTGDFGSVGAVSGNCITPVAHSSPEYVTGLSKTQG